MKWSILFLIGMLMGGTINAQSTHDLSLNSHVQEFFVAGSYHKEGLDESDWMALLEIPFMENEGLFGHSANRSNGVVVKASSNSIDLNQILGDSALAVAYVYCKISSARNANALLLVRANDGAKVYVNNTLATTFFGGGEEATSVALNEGVNDIVIKVPNKDWAWDLGVRILEEEQAARHWSKKKTENEHALFLHSNLQPVAGNSSSYTFYPGRFPKLQFEQPGLASQFLGDRYQLNTRWFDRELNEVLYPKEPGRFAYYAEAVGTNGKTIKKSGTLFCAPREWLGWNERLTADLSHVPVNDITRSTWEEHAKAISQYAGFTIFESIMTQGKGALLLAFMDEMQRGQKAPSRLNTPLIVDGDYHAQLKQKVLGVENRYPSLALPEPDETSMTLVPISKAEQERYQALHLDLGKAGEAWMDDQGSPFDMMVAKDGRIIYHESFGEDEYGKFTTPTPTEIASITKLFTGMLFAQFVDQNIIGIDDLVGEYLPDFPLEGPQALTLRHCFTHTGGFDFFAHGLYDGVHNPWLENILIETLQGDTLGTKLLYNGMGYDLAGKVMEVVTGKSIFRLFREYLYEPLGMTNTIHYWDLGYSVHSTAEDLAKLAQMILNKGSYGGKRFFSEETYKKLVPTELSKYYPKINQKWGIGMTMMDWHVDDGNGGKRPLLSDGIIGHGSATSSMFWVIPKRNMIISQSRRKGSRNFGPNYIKMMKVLEKHLPEKAGATPGTGDQ